MMDRWSGGGEVHALGSRFRGTKVVPAKWGEAGKGDKRCSTSKDAREELLRALQEGGTLGPKGAVGEH